MTVAARLPVLVAAALLATAVGLAAFVVSRGGSPDASDSRRTEVARPGRSVAAPAGLQAHPRPAAPRAAERSTVPPSLSRALTRNRVVVVSLFTPGSNVDTLARAEARSGAEAAGAGFVELNVLGEPRVARLAQRFDLLGTPAVLVLRRGPELRTALGGYADRETVAQAAANAAR